MPLFDLYEGQEIDISTLPNRTLSIQVYVKGSEEESVFFDIAGQINFEPYTLFGDTSS